MSIFAGDWSLTVLDGSNSPQQDGSDDCGYYATFVGAQITAQVLGVCDKPLAFTSGDAQNARSLVQALLSPLAQPVTVPTPTSLDFRLEKVNSQEVIHIYSP